MKRFATIVLILLVPFLMCAGKVGQKQLIQAIIEVESKDKNGKLGDKDLSQKAYGCLQIRQPCVDDVNSAFGTTYTAKNCQYDRALSVWVCEKYLSLYATKVRIGREPTPEDKARIWNGGPNGWKKKKTKGYWIKVKRALAQ